MFHQVLLEKTQKVSISLVVKLNLPIENRFLIDFENDLNTT